MRRAIVGGLCASLLLSPLAAALPAHAASATTVSGTVRLADGSPVAGVDVTAYDDDDIVADTRTTVDGTYRLTGVPAGRIVLEYYDPSEHLAIQYSRGKGQFSDPDPLVVGEEPLTDVDATLGPAPATPTGLAVVDADLDAATARLTWQPAERASRYGIAYWRSCSTVASCASVEPRTRIVPSPDVTLTGLTRDTRYEVVVWSTNDFGDSWDLADMAFRTRPVARPNFTALSSSTSSIALRWSGVEGATDYRIVQTEVATGRMVANAWFGPTERAAALTFDDHASFFNGTSMEAHRLKSDTAYRLELYARIGDEESRASTKVVSTKQVGAFRKPFVASLGTNPRVLRLPVPFEDRRAKTRVVVRTTTGRLLLQRDVTWSPRYKENVVTLKGLRPGTLYRVSATTVAPSGRLSPWSKPDDVRTQIPNPTKVRLGKIGRTSVKVTWKGSPGAKKYLVFVSRDPGRGGSNSVTVPGKTAATVRGLKPGTKYYVRIIAGRQNPGRSWSTGTRWKSFRTAS